MNQSLERQNCFCPNFGSCTLFHSFGKKKYWEKKCEYFREYLRASFSNAWEDFPNQGLFEESSADSDSSAGWNKKIAKPFLGEFATPWKIVLRYLARSGTRTNTHSPTRKHSHTQTHTHTHTIISHTHSSQLKSFALDTRISQVGTKSRTQAVDICSKEMWAIMFKRLNNC